MTARAPQRRLVLLADWSYVTAGVCLSFAFFILCLAFTLKVIVLAGAVAQVFKAALIAAGSVYTLGALAHTRRNILADDAAGAVSQSLVCFGAIFFMMTGIGDGVPTNVISLRYAFPLTPSPHVSFADACPFYGIICFMLATTISMTGVWKLQANQLVSPFWGVACFFIGAWTIGVFSLWGPCFIGGLTSYDDLGGKPLLPPSVQAATFVFQFIGAVFLAAGAVIFGQMDSIFCGKEAEPDPGTTTI